MVDSTWNRFNLLLQKGKLDNNNKMKLLLNAGADTFAMDLGCFVRIRECQYEVLESTNLQWKNRVFNTKDTLCKIVIRYKDALATHDLNAESWQARSIRDDFHFGAYIGMPLFIDDKLYGTIFFASKETREKPFTDRELAYLKLLSGSFLVIIKQSFTQV